MPRPIGERVGRNDGGALIYRRYPHLSPSEVREAVSILDRMVAGTRANAEAGGSAIVALLRVEKRYHDDPPAAA